MEKVSLLIISADNDYINCVSTILEAECSESFVFKCVESAENLPDLAEKLKVNIIISEPYYLKKAVSAAAGRCALMILSENESDKNDPLVLYKYLDARALHEKLNRIAADKSAVIPLSNYKTDAGSIYLKRVQNADGHINRYDYECSLACSDSFIGKMINTFQKDYTFSMDVSISENRAVFHYDIPNNYVPLSEYMKKETDVRELSKIIAYVFASAVKWEEKNICARNLLLLQDAVFINEKHETLLICLPVNDICSISASYFLGSILKNVKWTGRSTDEFIEEMKMLPVDSMTYKELCLLFGKYADGILPKKKSTVPDYSELDTIPLPAIDNDGGDDPTVYVSAKLIDEKTNEEYPIISDKFTIGRKTKSGMEHDLSIGKNTISRNHASIVKEGSDYYLIDNGSANGTFIGIDTPKLPKGQKVLLKDGDIVSFYQSRYKFTKK